MRSPRMFKRGKRGTWWVDYGSVGEIRHVRSTKTTDKVVAQRIAESMWQELSKHDERRRIITLTKPTTSEDWETTISAPEVRDKFQLMLKNAKSRAKSRGIIWAMSDDDFWRLVRGSNGKCAVTGLPFVISNSMHSPDQPSLDRIDSSTGYSLGNCRMVFLCVNYAMNKWGEDAFRLVALSYAQMVLKSAAG